MHIKIISHRTAEYEMMIELRMELLRRPLGLTFTKEQLDAEKDDILIAATENNEIVGCCVLTPIDNSTIQLRQMAVKENVQAKGIGRSIVAYAEKIARGKGYRLLMMHARDIAVGFYKKCGYQVKGDEFIEVSIPHYYMEKELL